tara:strand:+ start:783 stop:956 length:174 start_codon:yes stop_codon:yes gene_type:complete
MTENTVTKEEHSILIDFYQNKIKEKDNDIFNLEMKNATNNSYIKSLEEKLLKHNILK